MLKTSRDTDTYRRADADAQYILTTAVYIAKKERQTTNFIKAQSYPREARYNHAFFCKVMKFLYVARTI